MIMRWKIGNEEDDEKEGRRDLTQNDKGCACFDCLKEK